MMMMMPIGVTEDEREVEGADIFKYFKCKCNVLVLILCPVRAFTTKILNILHATNLLSWVYAATKHHPSIHLSNGIMILLAYARTMYTTVVCAT